MPPARCARVRAFVPRLMRACLRGVMRRDARATAMREKRCSDVAVLLRRASERIIQTFYAP